MIKRVIFDVDGTLIKKVDFEPVVRDTLDHFHYSYNEYQLQEYMKAMKTFEDLFVRYDMKNYIEYLKIRSGIRIDEEAMNYFLSCCSTYVDERKDDDVIETLDYLKDKYSLVVLTNYFKWVQEKRLETSGILKYFDLVIGGEEYIKPYVEAYRFAQGKYNTNECMMIGDDYEKDYEGASAYGFESILVDENSKYIGKNRIKNIKELKKVL